MINIGNCLYADSDLHVCLYADLLKVSATDQATVDQVDAFYYLIDIGFSPEEACLADSKDKRVIDLAVKAMKFNRLSEGTK